MKFVYCANCGTRLNIYRKALPKYSTIIDVVEYHKCSPTPMEIDLTPVDIPVFKETKGKNKFVQKLNDLGTISTEHLKDRRFETETETETKTESKKPPRSTAPPTLLNLVEDNQEQD